MQLVQILLPYYNNEGNIFSNELFTCVANELKEKFGGVTIFSNSPATGLWKENDETTSKDKIFIYEVMCDQIEKEWWKSYKNKLEKIFQQEVIVIRTTQIELIK